MKDLNFSNQRGTVNVTYRTDLLGTSGNFTVHSISGLPANNDTPPASTRDKLLVASFSKLVYNVNSFITFATNNKLQLTVADPNGANLVILARKFNDSLSDSFS